MTKRLLFSSWNATLAAVAALLSYEAARRIVRKKLSHTDAIEAAADAHPLTTGSTATAQPR